MKRNGSDYSATILGALFECGHITIWTDVDGVYSADPRKVCRPSVADSQREAMSVSVCTTRVNPLHWPSSRVVVKVVWMKRY